jgi:hypothetical protein
MSVDWLTWSNPVSIWWGALLIVSGINITLWFVLGQSGALRFRVGQGPIVLLPRTTGV